MSYTAEQLREWADNYEKTPEAGNAIPNQLRAHADALDKLASIEAAQGEDVRGPVERLKEARRIVWSMCADGRPPRMSIPAEDTDEDVFIVDTITATIAILESLSAKLAERDAKIAALKGHAEAMAERLDAWARIDECKCSEVDAYRRDFPKEEK